MRVTDVFHEERMSLPEKGRVIVERLRALRPEGEDLELDQLLGELSDAAEADDTHWFDLVWDGVYDWADAESVWIATSV